MSKKKFTKDLLPTNQIKDEVVELMMGRKRKLFLNFGLMFLYLILIISSLFMY